MFFFHATFANCVHNIEKILETPNLSSGHVKSSFDNPAEQFSPKLRK